MKPIFIAFIFVFGCAPTAWSLDWNDFRQNAYFVSEGGYFGHYMDAIIDSDYAYLVNYYGLEIWDISDPTSAEKISCLKIPGYVDFVTVRDGLAYVADNDLWIADVENPADPLLIGHAEAHGKVQSIILYGDLAYLADGGLSVVSIEDPTEPRLIGRGDADIRSARSVALKDDWAFVSGYNGIYTFSIEDHERPTLEGTLESRYYNNDIVVRDSLLYACLDDSFSILDCSNPLEMIPVDGFINDHTYDLELWNNLAFLSYQRYWITISDISDPTSIEQLTVIESGPDFLYRPNVYGIAVGNDLLLACEKHYGFEIFDISNINNVDSIGGGQSIPEHCAHYIDKDGDYIYVATGGDGLEVYSVIDPFRPVMVGSTGETFVLGYLPIQAYNSYVYYASSSWIRIFDVHDSENPQLAVEYRIEDRISNNYIEILIEDDLLFYAAPSHYPERNRPRQGSVLVYNLNDPLNPEYLSTVAGAIWLGGMAIDDQYLYTLDMLSLKIFDRSDPTDIVLVGELEDPGYGYTDRRNSVAVFGDWIYFALFDRLWVVNAEDRTEPEYAFTMNIGYQVNGLVVEGDRLFLSMSHDGFAYYSLENPRRPRQLGFYDTPGFACNLVVDGDLCYVADYFNFSIYSLGDSLIDNSVALDQTSLPKTFSLFAYPNPFNSITVIKYNLTKCSRIKLGIYDLNGRLVAELLNDFQPAGSYSMAWNASGMPSGTYICCLDAGGCVFRSKLVLVR